jgi:type II secretory ATPase GspE/PulE/Tfp pilus assembly ATPase PilB-like protein
MSASLWIAADPAALEALTLPLAAAARVLSDPPAYAPFVSYLLPIPFLIVLLIWAKLLAWADKDAEAARMPREMLNLGLLGATILAVAAFFLLPNFFLAFGAFLLILGIAAGVYLVLRKQQVGLEDLGPEFKEAVAGTFRGKGDKVRKAEEHDLPEGEILIYNKAGSAVPAPEAESDARPLWMNAQQLLAAPIIKGAERIDLVPKSGQSQVRYSVDGVTYPGPAFEAGAAAGTIAYLKNLIGLNPTERRKPQAGKMDVKSAGEKHKLAIQTRGSTEGEHLKIEVDVEQRYNKTLKDLGFRKSQLELLEAEKETGGIVLVAAPPNNGLKTLLYAMMRHHDAFTQHIQTLEYEQATELEGISHNVMERDQDEADRIDWVTSQLPDILMVQRLENPASAKKLTQYAQSNRAYVGIRAGSAFDALTRWRKFVGDDKLALANVQLVICGRVFRRLCAATKVAFNPDAATRKAMSIPADKQITLYRPHIGPILDAKGNEVPDRYCHGLGYKGRIGAFEILKVDDEVRQAIRAGGGGQQIKSLFRKQNGRYIQEMALGLVQVGETALPEVQRVLKGEDTPAPKRQSAQKPQPAAT